MNDPFRANRRPVFGHPASNWGSPERTSTRVMRTPSEIDLSQSRLGTVVFGATRAPQGPTPRGAFEGGVHGLLRSVSREERRPGLFVFATTTDGRLAGRLWLAATEAVRAGTVGRHELVDLPVSPDAALSLRHFLFIVRQVDGVVRFTALDLETPAGLHTRHGQQSSVQAQRPVLIRAAGLCFWCVPSGPGVHVPDDRVTAWALLNDAPPPSGPSLFDRIVRRAPSPRGVLTLVLDGRAQALRVDSEMVAQGLLVGRHERCDVVVPDNFASRVHATIVEIDDVLHVIDTGSSNGTWTTLGERVRCRPLRDGEVLLIGTARVEWREAH